MSAVGERKFVAPDGGWGWVIVFASVFSNIIVVPLLQGFGLLYRDVFIELDFSATDISTIINVNSAFGLILGMFIGPLLKIFGYRKVALGGTIFLFVGYLLCTTSTTFTDFMIYYGIINSVGFSATLSAYSLALNTYFNRRRNIASGLCTALTGLGPVIMPFIISLLLKNYGVRGTALILSALILHSFAGALLLHPVSWHTKKETDDEQKIQELKLLKPDDNSAKIVITPSVKEEYLKDVPEEDENDDLIDEVDIQKVYGVETPTLVPTKSFDFGRGGFSSSKLSLNEKSLGPDSTWWRRESNTYTRRMSRVSVRNEKKKSPSKKWITKIIKFFDFDLLKDAGYRNIWLGMSLAFTAEINFSLMTPLILGDKGMTIEQTAQLMSAFATADIVFRFISPFLGDLLKWSAKHMYMASLVLLVFTRGSLTLAVGYNQIMASCLSFGVAKGLRTVYMALVIPSYVPLEKLASASGLQTLLNGLLLISVGPVLGYLRDTVGNYDICIHVINSFSICTIILWTVELVYNSRKSKRNPEEQEPPER